MSRTRTRAGCAGPVEVRPRLALVLRWSLSPEAAVAAGLIGAAEAAEPVLELRLPWDGPVDGVEAVLVKGEQREGLGLEAAPAGAWMEDGRSGLRHLDLPGLVRVTARGAGPEIEVLYARTEVLGRLGLAGGRYDFVGGSLAVCVASTPD